MNTLKIRLHCSLYHSTPEFAIQFEDLRETLIRSGYEIVNGMDWLRECFLYVAILDCNMTYESFIEIAEAAKNHIKVLGCAHINSKISQRLETSIIFERFVRYVNMVDDIVVAIAQVQGSG